MILEVQHETRLTYPEAVVEAITEARMEPVSDLSQTCRSFHLGVTPAADVFRFQDGFGNRVHHFNVLGSHSEVRMLAAAVVDTHPRAVDPLSCRAVYPLDVDQCGLEVLDFVQFRGPVRPSPRLSVLLDALRPQSGTPLGELVLVVSRYIHEHFEYASDVTLASSPVDDILDQGKGVCQDFTHLLIAVLRSFGVPARYVSGYIHRVNRESQSHAWCEVWLPELGWVGIDPTNDCLVAEHFIKVAVGRDFTDVPPNKGIHRGRAQQQIQVRVETRELVSLPSFSWQEQLPPLHVPLTVIRFVPWIASWQEGEGQQQQ
jgi:transglutaminase-like putative cysteine protease